MITIIEKLYVYTAKNQDGSIVGRFATDMEIKKPKKGEELEKILEIGTEEYISKKDVF